MVFIALIFLAIMLILVGSTLMQKDAVTHAMLNTTANRVFTCMCRTGLVMVNVGIIGFTTTIVMLIAS